MVGKKWLEYDWKLIENHWKMIENDPRMVDNNLEIVEHDMELIGNIGKLMKLIKNDWNDTISRESVLDMFGKLLEMIGN